MRNKVSVITIVYNDVENIESTLESFFSQTWEEKEYIVIDGGSQDGTVDIIKKYADQLAFWCSEPDGGIYDAMNKGVLHACGDWICILNAGDVFVSPTALEQVFTIGNFENVDVIYGDSVEINTNDETHLIAGSDIRRMDWEPIYRHGSSLVRTSVHKKELFDLSKKSTLGYALDWEMIHRLYKKGYTFQKVNVPIEAYIREGTSNNLRKSLRYNYRITSEGHFNLKKYIYYLKTLFSLRFSTSRFYLWLRGFFMEYVLNDLLPHIPFWKCRRAYLRKMRARIGKASFIMKDCYFIKPNNLFVGDYTHINRGCLIDARGGITIGNNVSISYGVKLLTGSHDISSPTFRANYLPITIEEFAWLGAGCTILNNVRIGKGAVVCAGAVVTRDVEDYAVVGGIPARKLKTRPQNLQYHCIWDSPFT